MPDVLTNGFPVSIHRFKMNNTAEDENKLIDSLISILNKKWHFLLTYRLIKSNKKRSGLSIMIIQIFSTLLQKPFIYQTHQCMEFPPLRLI